jgi:hypothetical protein
MSSCDHEVIIEQRSTAAAGTDPNVCLLMSTSQFVVRVNIKDQDEMRTNHFYLPGKCTETGLVSTDDTPLRRQSLLRRTAVCAK